MTIMYEEPMNALDEAADRLEELEGRTGSWQAERPTEPGRYWVKQHQHKRVVNIWRSMTDNNLYTNEDGGAPLEDPMYDEALWWSEQIVEPE